MALDKLQEAQGIALEDFVRDFNQAPFELIDGERIPWMPNLAGHTEMIDLIKEVLKDYLRENPIGKVFSEVTFVAEYSKDWLKGSLIPDILFFEGQCLAQY